MRHATRSGTAVIAALLASVSAAHTAGASPTRTSPAPPIDGGSAGYEAAFPAGEVHLVTTVILPTLDCDPEVEEGIVTQVALQSEDGPLVSQVQLSSYCHFGEPLHWLWINTDTGVHGFDESVGDGDRLRMSMRVVNNGGDIRIRVTDKTRGWTVRDRTTGAAADHALVSQNHLNWLTEDPLILSDDTRVKHVRLSGEDLASLDPVTYQLVESGELLMKPSPIRNGTDFTFRYVG